MGNRQWPRAGPKHHVAVYDTLIANIASVDLCHVRKYLEDKASDDVAGCFLRLDEGKKASAVFRDGTVSRCSSPA